MAGGNVIYNKPRLQSLVEAKDQWDVAALQLRVRNGVISGAMIF